MMLAVIRVMDREKIKREYQEVLRKTIKRFKPEEFKVIWENRYCYSPETQELLKEEAKERGIS